MYKEIQSGAVAKSYMRKGFLIYEEMRKYFPIYEEAVSHIWLCICSILNFLIYEGKLVFLFYQCRYSGKQSTFQFSTSLSYRDISEFRRVRTFFTLVFSNFRTPYFSYLVLLFQYSIPRLGIDIFANNLTLGLEHCFLCEMSHC